MARPKTFDPALVLPRIVSVFRERGYAGTSLADLEEATGLGRQSLYDTFGDKTGMFTAALAREAADEEGQVASLFDGANGGLGALRRYLMERASRLGEQGGCLLAAAALERGRDPTVRELLQAMHTRLLGAVATVLSIAARRGEIRAAPAPAALARTVVAHWAGMPVRWGAGASAADLISEADALIGFMRNR